MLSAPQGWLAGAYDEVHVMPDVYDTANSETFPFAVPKHVAQVQSV